MSDQFLAPCCSTSLVKILSSSALHGPLILSSLFWFVGFDSEEHESDDDVAVEELLFIASKFIFIFIFKSIVLCYYLSECL